jgi:hypothetical protein
MSYSRKKRAFSKATLREVKKEMAKPRMAESTRKGAMVKSSQEVRTPGAPL